MSSKRRTMYFLDLLLILILTICKTSASEVPRPRGVSLSRASLYSPDKPFTCFDNSLVIPFTQVNDDYCDCPDASDEPGTSACPHGIFHCTNAGHKPVNIPASRVNDGVCDCCDASDEYLTDRCSNSCKELGRTAREEAQKRAELVKAGKQLRADLSEKGIKLKREKKDLLVDLQKQKAEAERVLKEKEDIKKNLEELESVALEQYRKIEEENKRKQQESEEHKMRQDATQAFEQFDKNNDGLVDVDELKAADKEDKISEETVKYFFDDKDSVELKEFISITWPKMVSFWKTDAGSFKPPTGEGSVEEVNLDGRKQFDVDDGLDHDDDPGKDDETTDNEEEEEVEETEEAEPDEPSNSTTYDEETQELVNQATHARSEFTEAEQQVRNIQNEINSIDDYLNKDFGPDESFAALVNNCYEYTDYEYIYKLCPFDRVTQQSKSGSIETRLGGWGKWSGPEFNVYESMLYDHGQSCWNGPTRSTIVKVNCNSETKVTAVSEPNRCEYLFEFSTPAACLDSADEQHTDDVHDEL